MNGMRNLLVRFKKELQVYRNILADPRTPRLTKILLGAAIAYTFSPVDLIPDFIPGLGLLDDLIIVPLLIYFAMKSVPRALVLQHRQAVEDRVQEGKPDAQT